MINSRGGRDMWIILGSTAPAAGANGSPRGSTRSLRAERAASTGTDQRRGCRDLTFRTAVSSDQ